MNLFNDKKLVYIKQEKMKKTFGVPNWLQKNPFYYFLILAKLYTFLRYSPALGRALLNKGVCIWWKGKADTAEKFSSDYW